jgi:hypothetical protein
MKGKSRGSVSRIRVSATVGLWFLAFFGSLAGSLAGSSNDAWATEAEERLKQILAGTVQQSVRELDRDGLNVVLNERFDGVQLEGWNTVVLSDVEREALLKKFGVRAVANPADGTAAFLAPNNVGRAGILEGDVYLRLDGKVYRGLTLKGYGGNTVHGKAEQPNGSLELDEAIRDMEVSTILAEAGVDTYVGVLIVERGKAPPRFGGAPVTQANFVRLSRTALRMEDLIRVPEQDLPALVDYFTDLLEEEVGRKMTRTEFTQWLVEKSGDVMARKDYIRFMHASITDSNLGIGELVDLGDGWGGAGMKLAGDYRSQNLEFKRIVERAVGRLVKVDAGTRALPWSAIYDEAYRNRFELLREFDRARINLSSATEVELTSIGFTAEEAQAVVRLNVDLVDGIVDPTEVKALRQITRDIDAILVRTTTDFLRLSDRSQLGGYYLRTVGGADGVRGILSDARELIRTKGWSLSWDANAGRMTGNVSEIEREVARLAIERARAAGNLRAVTAAEVTNLGRFLARQALEVIVRR